MGSDVRPVRNGRGLNLIGTIRAAADRGAHIDAGRLEFIPTDLRGSLRRGKEANLIVFLVDSSGSMAARDRLNAVTGAVHSLLGDAYQRRDKVAVITVRGSAPEIVLQPTGSIDIAKKRLDGLPTGGRTPLAEGLNMAHELIEREYRREPGRPALLVVLTDGRATGKDGLAHLRSIAATIAQRGHTGSVIVDCEKGGRIRLGLATELAQNLGGTCVRIEELNAEALTEVIQAL
ncbi:vWA domain-containing protein [Corynebacterium kutscheri]|uniref:vWA domain-containing protein n=1 Tax=Corynebacterium kutscheri TaxID=35755 RepID=UPI0006231F45|nr:VWA domain-containing protein [Corynebacterium kutscheri]